MVKIRKRGDGYDVVGGGRTLWVQSKAKAKEIAAARRRVKKKRAARVKSGWWF